MTMTNTTEAVARAICQAKGFDSDSGITNTGPLPIWTLHQDQAESAITALREQGWLPPEAVQEVRNKALLAFARWAVKVAFAGGSADGGEIQEKALSLGLIGARIATEETKLNGRNLQTNLVWILEIRFTFCRQFSVKTQLR